MAIMAEYKVWMVLVYLTTARAKKRPKLALCILGDIGGLEIPCVHLSMAKHLLSPLRRHANVTVFALLKNLTSFSAEQAALARKHIEPVAVWHVTNRSASAKPSLISSRCSLKTSSPYVRVHPTETIGQVASWAECLDAVEAAEQSSDRFDAVIKTRSNLLWRTDIDTDLRWGHVSWHSDFAHDSPTMYTNLSGKSGKSRPSDHFFSLIRTAAERVLGIYHGYVSQCSTTGQYNFPYRNVETLVWAESKIACNRTTPVCKVHRKHFPFIGIRPPGQRSKQVKWCRYYWGGAPSQTLSMTESCLGTFDNCYNSSKLHAHILKRS